MRLACCIAAEETAVQPEALTLISSSIGSQLDDLAQAARDRLRLSSMLLGAGESSSPMATATAVSTTLFGSPGSLDDEGSEGFFKGTEQADYYDPRNSYVDCVFARRRGIPITLSLIYLEVCERLQLPMVGLNAPGHLLLAPADPSLPFVVDPFTGGRVMSSDDASVVIARNAGSVAMNPGAASDPLGAQLLRALRDRPMDSHMWCARMLRNLRAIHAASEDVVGILGTAERLRLVAAAQPSASSPGEQLECAVQLASGIRALQWEARRGEARELLEDILRAEDDGSSGLRLAAEGRQQLEGLLGEDWFRK